jgi:pSer/pThr/pTyr-binding forkhead associated (FHA) protein
MDANEQPKGKKRGPASVWAGELIVQNGRQSGARRPLQVPLTIVGKDPTCDIRLNSEGIDSLHCLLVHGPSGLIIRDLDSASGTFVNGERVNSVNLKEGDLLTIGGFQFRLNLPPRSFAISEQVAEGPDAAADRDAVRLQTAAVAAQQVALGEEEVRLLQRKTALERQEEQLSSHLEEKRRKILALHERAQAERRSLQQDRVAYEEHVAKITGDLTTAQREVLDHQEKLWAERRRLAELYRRLRRRLHNQWEVERDRIGQREEELARKTRELEQEGQRLRALAQSLNEQRLEHNGEMATDRNQMQLGWQRLRQSQIRWRERRVKEHQNLRQREKDVAEGQRLLAETQQRFIKEKTEWEKYRKNLDLEVDGLEKRVRNQRHKIIQHQLEINRLDTIVRLREGTESESTALVPIAGTVPAKTMEADNAVEKHLLRGSARAQYMRGKQGKGRAKTDQTAAITNVEVVAAANPGQLAQLERLAGDLTDQRIMLLEQWQRLVQTQHAWENERAQCVDDLEKLTLMLQSRESTLGEREQYHEQAEHQFRLRQRELTHLRQHLVAWRARLKTRENALEGERSQLVVEVQNREDLVEKHMAALVDLRRRWSRRRRQELARLHSDCTAFAKLLEECNGLRRELLDRSAALDQEKRILTDKSLALEEARQEFLLRIDHPGAERRLERLERRWVVQNEAACREVALQREALQSEMAAVQARFGELLKRQQAISQSEHDLAIKLTAFEHQESLAGVRNTRLEQERNSAEAQSQLLEQQLIRVKEEVERIARQLIEDPQSQPTAEFAPRAKEIAEPEAVKQAA